MNNELVCTEDRAKWYAMAEDWERLFCRSVAPRYGINVKINPLKNINPAVNDLVIKMKNGKIVVGELKPQFTPFYLSKAKYGIDPQYAFALNLRDLRDIPKQGIVFLWVSWDGGVNYGISIRKMERLYYEWGHKFIDKIKELKPPIHRYGRRVYDPRNAKRSYIFDVRNFTELTARDN